MGGRGSSSASAKQPSVMSLDEYMASKGVSDPLSGYLDDKTRLPHGETQRQKEQREKKTAEAIREHGRKRAEARAEYQALVDAGKVRPPTKIEEKLRIAKGHPDNASVQAARRSLKKRGIDWRTGKKI